jgi:RNA-directed DNA polymerase
MHAPHCLPPNNPKRVNMQVTDAQMNDAYRWLCQRRRHFPPNADIWWFRHRFANHRAALLADINAGSYRFSAQLKIATADGKVIHLWEAQDALVMKLMAIHLQASLHISPCCTHVVGHGGLKQSIVDVQQQLSDYQYVCKTDVKGYYASIDQYRLMDMIHDTVEDSDLCHYLYQVIHRTVETAGNFRDIDQGIARGCSLSPILGALYLQSLDNQFADSQHYYLRYMDDILILSKTRWQNRKAVKRLNQCLNRLTLEKHPDKTFIGKIDKGFDFLGYHFSRAPLTVADKTREKHALHCVRLYEQLRRQKATANVVAATLERYITRWQRWVVAGLQGITINGQWDCGNGESSTDRQNPTPTAHVGVRAL